MDYKKPQSTLVQGSVGIYPLTTADQVILADGSRLEKDGKINADKLGGKTLAEIMLTLYPVGAVYISANITSPASLFGGTWEQLKDRFLLGAGGSYDAGSTGGEAAHTLTNDEIPAHRHAIYLNDVASGGEFWGPNNATPQGKASANATDTAGGNQPHNNMPPYISVYMWKRVS